MTHPNLRLAEADLPNGVSRIHQLPDSTLGRLWDSIVIDEAVKQQLLAQAILNFTIRAKVARTELPLHGVILLVGKPGTGKTSLARGLSNRVAQSFRAGFRLIEVEPHMLTSSSLGKSQRAVSDLFSQSIAEAAAAGPCVVLLDEVETLAADRSKMSLEANPVDVHRATDAVLVQLDALAESHPNLLFVATSNFPEAVDSAFTSRCDLVLEIPLPNEQACRQILDECLAGVAKSFPAMERLRSGAAFDRCARECVGLDGRAIRKMVANALASDVATALKPETVTPEQLLAAAVAARKARTAKGLS